MAQAPLSLRAYAAHRKAACLPGGSLQAVQRAIEAERISCVLVNGQKRIPDPEAADREWAANTDLSRAPGYVKDWAADGPDDDADADGPSLKDASAREKHWKAELAELTYRERAGQLVDGAEAAAGWADLCSTVRTKLLGLPSRMKQRHPELTLDHLATLEELVRQDLEELASDGDDGRAE